MSVASIRSHLKSCWETISFRLTFPQTFCRNQKGQTIVEYILLLVVILTIAYAIGRHFFTPLQRYGASVFTSTIACALEYGQLPAEITSEEGCDASLQVTAMGGSRGGAGSSSGAGSGTGSSGGQNGKNSQQGSDKKEDAASQNKATEGSSSADGGAKASSESGGGRGSGGGGSTTVVSRGGTLQLGKSPGVDSGRSGTNEIVYSSNQGGGADVDYGPGGSRVRRRKPIYKPVAGEVMDEVSLRKKKEKVIEGAGARSIAGGDEGGVTKTKRIVINTNREVKKAERQEASWDISKILRIALIVLMVIAILLFVFFQVSQIRKGSGSS